MAWLTDKVALITGAGEGIGKAVARRFLEEGVRGVVAFDLAEDRLTALQDELGDRVVTIRGDVRNVEDNRDAVSRAVSRFGKLDVLVGNAGVRDGRRRLAELSDKELVAGFDEVFAINVKGYLLGAAAAREELARQRVHHLHPLDIVVLRRRRADLYRLQTCGPRPDPCAGP